MPGPDLPPPGFPPHIPVCATLAELHGTMVRCTRCGLFLSRTQVVPGAGPADAALLIVGEAPGKNEDQLGEPFVGRSGALLDEMLRATGVRRNEVFIANVVRCRPPANRAPRTSELRACAGWLEEQVRLIRPKLIVTLGRFALQHFIPSARITAVQGALQKVRYGSAEVGVYPLLHPSAVLRNPALRQSYAAQFQRLTRLLRELEA